MNWQIDHKTLFMFMDGISQPTPSTTKSCIFSYMSLTNRIKWIRRVVVSPNSAALAARAVGTSRNFNLTSSEHFMNMYECTNRAGVTLRDVICYCGTLDYGNLLR